MSPGSRFVGCVLAVLLAGVATAQQVLTVGPGQTYATLGAAIAAAAPGDTVLAIGGSYLENLDIDKPLQLVGRGALLRTAFPGSGIHVHDLAPNEPFLMRGFTLQIGSNLNMFLQVSHCEGPVMLHDLGNQSGAEMWFLQIDQSTQVHVARVLCSSVFANASVVSFEQCVVDPAQLVPGVTATASAISLVQCSIHGAFSFGAPAVRLQGGGTLVATRSGLTGISSGFGVFPAIEAQAGDVLLLDPSTTLTATGPLVTGATPVPLEFASLRASTNGTVATVDAHGPANEIFVVVFTSVAPALTTPFGLTWLDVGSFAPLYAGIYDPVTRRHTEAIPHAVSPAGQTLALQAINLSPSGLTLGLPTVLSMP